MKINQSRSALSVLLITLFITSCSTGSSVTQEPDNTVTPSITVVAGNTEVSPPTQSESTPTSESTESSLCTNAYYPVRQGATWTYKSAGSPAGDYSFTESITSVREDGFTLRSQFGEVTRTQEWGCEPEGLVALQLGGPSAATLSSQNIQFNLEVKTVSGVTFPRAISPGDQWQHNLDFEGSLGFAGQSGEAEGDAQAGFTAVGNENVTVPAGTFETLKIQMDTTLNMNVVFQGLSVPVTFNASYTYWFVEDIGWVKASGTGNVRGQSFTETIELQSYSVP